MTAILAISSEPLTRKIMDRLLRRLGYSARVVANELDALDALDGTTFDAMIVDTGTIDLDVPHFVKLVRMGRLGMEPLPIIALGSDGEVPLLDELGVEAVLTKPLSPRALLDALAGVSKSQASSRGR